MMLREVSRRLKKRSGIQAELVGHLYHPGSLERLSEMYPPGCEKRMQTTWGGGPFTPAPRANSFTSARVPPKTTKITISRKVADPLPTASGNGSHVVLLASGVTTGG